MTLHRPFAAAGVVMIVAGLTACSSGAPTTVVPGSEVTVGWAAELTSLNAAAAPTPGNIDIAAATRGDFGDVVDGEFVPDESYGTISIVSDTPFTVRYDLAEPTWSDGIPLDAADLVLAWAASTGRLEPDADGNDTADPDEVPVLSALDEFSRSIEVTFPAPTISWQTVIEVAVPAHVVGQRALGLDDPMEAKQAVIRAVQEDDATALDSVAETWTEAFDVAEETEISADLRLSSGPFQVDQVTRAVDGQSVTLVPNASYTGAASPQIARIDLVPEGEDPVSAIGTKLDVAEVTPTVQNRGLIRELERRDNPVVTSHDGSVWTVLLRPAGVFAQLDARSAFLRTIPAGDLVDRGSGDWASAYTATTSMLSAPGSPLYDVVSEDSGFAAEFGAPSGEPALERASAGVAAGAPVCVLYDRGSELAVGAFTALREAVGEEGWNVIDCGADDVDTALTQPGWDAAIVRVPLPATPAEIAAQWGTGSPSSLVGNSDTVRDDLIAQLGQTVDVYEARELTARIEATIVRAAVARPLALNPTVTITDREVMGVSVRSGPVAQLTQGLAEWSVTP